MVRFTPKLERGRGGMKVVALLATVALPPRSSGEPVLMGVEGVKGHGI